MATTAPTGDTANKTRKAKQRGVLTDKAISQAKPLEKSHKLADGNGLYLFGQSERIEALALEVPRRRQREADGAGRVPGREPDRSAGSA